LVEDFLGNTGVDDYSPPAHGEDKGPPIDEHEARPFVGCHYDTADLTTQTTGVDAYSPPRLFVAGYCYTAEEAAHNENDNHQTADDEGGYEAATDDKFNGENTAPSQITGVAKQVDSGVSCLRDTDR
jgi:hypothetical protein